MVVFDGALANGQDRASSLSNSSQGTNNGMVAIVRLINIQVTFLGR